MISSVYIVQPVDHSWIIERLMSDIKSELNLRGIIARVGPSSGYQGEEIIFNSRYLNPFCNDRAKINSLFITHVDDKIKELELKNSLKRFNSFICMSAQDADFIAELNECRDGVVGIDLPTRDLKIRPVRIVLFSACYEDGRKNEDWIINYFQNKTDVYKQNFIFCFMGWGWERMAHLLDGLEMNYEIYRYSRFLPGEYDLYKEKLPSMDVLIYIGFDGGAMSVYDGMNAGLDIIASDISYHRGLGESVRLFKDKEGFHNELDRLHAKNMDRKEAILKRSISEYTDKLIMHWCSLLNMESTFVNNGIKNNNYVPSESNTLKLYRSYYKKIDLSRLRSFAIRVLKSIMAFSVK